MLKEKKKFLFFSFIFFVLIYNQKTKIWKREIEELDFPKEAPIVQDMPSTQVSKPFDGLSRVYALSCE